MHSLGKNVPDKDPARQENIVLDNLQQVEAAGCFGHLSFAGKFREAGINLLLTQNFDHGIFVQLDIPIRRLEIRNVSYSDCTLQPGQGTPNRTNPEWQECKLFGKKGGIDLWGSRLITGGNDDVMVTPLKLPSKDIPVFEAQDRDFIQAVKKKKAPTNSAKHAVALMQIIDALRKSAEKGKSVRIS